MKRRSVILAGTALFTMGLLALAGAASATISVSGSLIGVDNVDIYHLKCNSSATKCATAQICDSNLATHDTWQVTLEAYAPAGILGKGDLATIIQDQTGPFCSPVIEVCRPTAGPIKALVAVTKSVHAGFAYDLTVDCKDKDGAGLPNASHTLSPVTNQ